MTDTNNYVLPEFGRLIVADDNFCSERYEWFVKNGLIQFDKSLGKYCLNSRRLHEKVFISNIQRAASCVRQKVSSENAEDYFDFAIEKFRKNPPAVNIEISIRRNVQDSEVNRCLLIVNNCYYTGFVQGRYEAARYEKRTLINVDIVPGMYLSSAFFHLFGNGSCTNPIGNIFSRKKNPS